MDYGIRRVAVDQFPLGLSIGGPTVITRIFAKRAGVLVE